jgi:hypothetical protein
VVAARKVLHAAAEHLVAGPQHRRTGKIRLAVTGRGFASTQELGPGLARLEVTAGGIRPDPGGVTIPLAGSVRSIASRLGIEPGPPRDLYTDHAELGLDDELVADEAALDVVLGGLATGAAALAQLPGAGTPVLWPEHFDVASTLAGITYGVSPGDAGHPLPYAYVSPGAGHTGDFWNEPFGASRPLAELSDAEGTLAFFRAGRQEAARTGP